MISVRARLQNHNSGVLTEKGQAVVEYVLLLVVGIILVGLLAQVYRPFGRYLEANYTDYLQCLLEAGELPSTPNGLCKAVTFSANVTSTPSNPSSTPTAPGSSGSQTSSERGRTNRATPQVARTRGANEASSSGSSSSSTAASGGSSAQRGRNRGGGGGEGSEEQGSGQAGEVYTGSSANSSANFVIPGGDRPRKQRLDDDFVIVDNDRPATQRVAASVSSPKGERSAEDLRQPRVRDTFNPKKPVTEAVESGFSLGFALRFILIAAIVIALILLVAGQLLQISKSMD